MDANGLRLWSYLRPADWRLGGGVVPAGAAAAGVQWSSTLGMVRLARQSPAPAPAETEARARQLAAAPSLAFDAAGTWAFWDSATSTLRAAGAGLGSTPLDLPPDTPPGSPTPGDLALGADDILYVARNGGVVLVDRRDRFPPARAVLAGFHADRLAPAPGGGVWALDRTQGALARLTGQPLRSGPYFPRNDDIFQPVEPNPDPPTLRPRHAALPAGLTAVDIATSPAGQLMLLAWTAGAPASLLRWQDSGWTLLCTLTGLVFPFSLGFVDEGRVAVLATATGAAGLAPQAFVYDLDVASGAALPDGDIFPLVAPWPGGLAKALGLPARYPIAATDTRAPATLPPEPLGLRPLRPVSRAAYARAGHVLLGPADAGASGAVWHRLYLEACLPEHCGVRVWLHADDAGGVPAPPGAAGAPDWHLHVFGPAAARADIADAPQGAWLPVASELPFHPGLLPCDAQPDRTGLFTALVQRPGRQVRALAGRYLWLYVELLGNSLATPEIAALRVHGPRFAYRDRYLPAFYRESLFPPDADAAGTATAPDFLGRFLGLFEGELTPLEDRVAGSWLLTDPATTPDDALEWLAAWIGIAFECESDPARRRQILQAAPYTARLHGTLGGLLAAFELATGGVLVRGGQVDLAGDVPRPGQLALATLNDTTCRVLVMAVAAPGSGGETAVLVGGAITSGVLVAVEAFRLRRTFATILGANLADTDDPLTQGLSVSGNSYVGDTLFLGDALRQDFLALFRADTLTTAEQAAVTRFLDTLAGRVLVLVHDSVQPADWRRLRRIAEAASPAHVATSVVAATARLIVGVASLVGLDTFLAPHVAPGTVTIGGSQLGLRDLLGGGGLLDARGEAPPGARPTAAIDGPATVQLGQGFLLSGLRSRAAPGHSLAQYVWLNAGVPPPA